MKHISYYCHGAPPSACRELQEGLNIFISRNSADMTRYIIDVQVWDAVGDVVADIDDITDSHINRSVNQINNLIKLNI